MNKRKTQLEKKKQINKKKEITIGQQNIKK